MKAAVITFPGSNCDDDAVYALERLCGFSVDKLWHKDAPSLADYSLVVVPGGFSYGDYLRCGAMAAVSNIMPGVRTFADNGGLVLGICNGFQIICEVGLVPGALVRNAGLEFRCHDVELQVAASNNPWFSESKVGDKVTYPIAHGEGRYVLSDAEYAKMVENGQIVLRYVKNPNGSLHDIAGVCNEKKNVFGLMPHPERASDLRSGDGMKLWNSVKSFLGASK